MEKIFKAYDIRGIYPRELDEAKAYRIAHAFIRYLQAPNLLIGHDARLSSPSLAEAFMSGAAQEKAEVYFAGMVSTDMIYFGLGKFGYSSACMITASHNPKEYNGFKLLRESVIPLSEDAGLPDVERIYEMIPYTPYPSPIFKKVDLYPEYAQHVLSFIDPQALRPLKVVMDAGNGVMGVVAKVVFSFLPQIEIIPLNFVPDGNFPAHEPNPQLEENRVQVSEEVRRQRADLGIAWDGDGDRCFFFDNQGEFIDGYYITALLIEAILRKHPGEKVIFDPRLIWANLKATEENGGIPIINRAGHSFIKARMRQENAIFGGETSGHFYFRENFYADNGMIPALLILELLSLKEKSISELVYPLKSKYFVSGEINIRIAEPQEALRRVEEHFRSGKINKIDGLSVEFPDWRFNLRPSQTEPLLRLNVEAYKEDLLKEKTEEILSLIH